MKKNNVVSILIYVVLIGLLCWMVIGLFSEVGNQIPYSEVVGFFRDEQVKSCVMTDSEIFLELRNPYKGETSVSTLLDVETFWREMGVLLQEQHKAGILERYDRVEEKPLSFYDMILPLLIVGVVLLMVWAFLMSRANNNNPMNNFGKARTVLGVPDGKKVTFDDVAGADEENCREWWISSGIPRNLPRSAPGSLMACCW